jgi:hypothetical protein
VHDVLKPNLLTDNSRILVLLCYAILEIFGVSFSAVFVLIFLVIRSEVFDLVYTFVCLLTVLIGSKRVISCSPFSGFF